MLATPGWGVNQVTTHRPLPFFPDLRAIHPALAVAGEQHFQRLGEAGLPRPVAPDDDGKAGAGSEGECLPGADAAEALDGELGEVCAGVGGCRCLLVGLRRRLGVLENAVDRVAAVAGGKDEGGPVLRNQILGDEAVVDEASQVGVHGQVAS